MNDSHRAMVIMTEDKANALGLKPLAYIGGYAFHGVDPTVMGACQSWMIPNFIEEVVRLETPFKFHYRFVNHDTQLCGTPLKAGDVLLLGWASANRDPAVWECRYAQA